ncbi:MAG: hypothetical protein ACREO3_09605 [Arenimonas sp.]
MTLAPGLAKHHVLTLWTDRGIASQNEPLADAIRIAGAKKLTTAHMPTDHAFSDHRIALSRSVIAWLETLP